MPGGFTIYNLKCTDILDVVNGPNVISITSLKFFYQLNYTFLKFLGHLSTITEDSHYILTHMANYNNSTPFISSSKSNLTNSSQTVYLNYYKQIPKALLDDLQEAYQIDYDLFGYKSIKIS